MNSCPVCLDRNTTKIYNETLFACQNCTHTWADLSLDESQLRALYAENYFKGEEYADYLADKMVLQSNFKKRLNALQKLSTPPTYKNVLEIGCAYGFFGDLLLKTHATSDYKGFDISEVAIDYANEHFGNHFSSENYLTSKKPNKNYTDIFMWDVIEHLPNPVEFIEKIASETASGGRIYITTGDISAWLPRRQKDKWRMIHPPTHVHYFTKKSIAKLLRQYDFEIEKLSYPPVNRSIRVIFYSLFMLNKKFGKFTNSIYNSIPEKASLRLNTRDIMFVVAKKK
jgi:2-polyprenyl-3-methyl-5-hydroxy-6-metoxy-1,4-benzoquinol methylase